MIALLLYLNSLFVGLLLLSNIISVKLFDIGGIFILPAAVIVYVFTYPLTDVIGEVYGKEAAQRTVKAGFFTQLIASIFIFISIKLPPAPFFEFQSEYETILSGGFRIIMASLLAYLASQNIDVHIFHKLRDRYNGEKLWLRNNASTLASQLVDTSIFITIAFYGTMPLNALITLIFTQYAFKAIVAILDTPLVYLLVALSRKYESKTGQIYV